MDADGRSSRSSHTLALLALLISLAVVVVACGDGDDGTEAATLAAPATTAYAAGGDPQSVTGDASGEATGDADEDGVPDSIEALASESGSATVTIGDQTVEFSLAGTTTVDGSTYVGRCVTIFGMIAAAGFAADGRDITIDAEVPPVDWETYEDDRYDAPSIRVEDGEADADWVADQGDEFVSGSGVGEFEQDGGRASGTATFINAWDPGSEPVEGTFELDCAG